MAVIVPFFLYQLACAWFQCEVGSRPPFLYLSSQNSVKFVETLTGRSGVETNEIPNNDPIVLTKLGFIQGNNVNISDGRQIYSFTGVPYGEKPERFRDPVPKKPWRGILQAKSPSPHCIQTNAALIGNIRGEENCLYIDVHTPKLPNPKDKKPGMPVIIFIPGGANVYGRSRSYGPAYLLREDIIFIPINVRYGIYGFLSTGDEASPGNYGLKDQALAIKWVYENIEAFGGDPRKIIVAGLSSGAYAAHLMLFTKNEARNYVAGIITFSGTAMGNHALDTRGRVRDASNIIAKEFGCPTTDEGKSHEMVECLRKVEPYTLASQLVPLYKTMPPFTKMWGPTIEPDLPNAFISELPEVLYEKGKVPPIPAMFCRSEDESSFMLVPTRPVMPIVAKFWNDWMPKFLVNGMRSNKDKIATFDESQLSLIKLNRFYFNTTTAPNFLYRRNFLKFADLISDAMYNAPMWKSVELHHKVAPTFVYINKHKTFGMISPIMDFYLRTFHSDFGTSHATDTVLLFNNSKVMAPLPQGSDFDIASRNLINMIHNFGVYGRPLYRTSTGVLLDVWKPIQDMKSPLVLEVGLVHNISMIRDPLPGSGRMEIWDELKW